MRKNSNAFINQLLICLLVTFGFSGSIGLGTVWMRHQISVTANANRALAAEIARIERLEAEKKTLVKSAERPDELRRLNREMRLGLVPMNEVAVQHVAEDVIERLVERANRGLYSGDRAAAEPLVKFALR